MPILPLLKEQKMDQEFDRRIGECDVKIENAEKRIKGATGEDKKYLAQRLKDLDGVRKKLVKDKNAS